MKKTTANIYLFELLKLNQQKETILKSLANLQSKSQTTFSTISDKGKSTQNFTSTTQNIDNLVLIREKSNSHTHPFLLTSEIFNKNVHNFLVDSSASSNVMPYNVCKKLNSQYIKSTSQIVQLDKSNVKVLGELKNVLIRLSSNPKIQEIIDIFLVDMPESYVLLLSKDW